MLTMYVYGIQDPDSLLYRYIGISHNPARRLATHRTTLYPWLPLTKWLRAIKVQKKEAILRIMEETTSKEALSREVQWINKLIHEGHPLFNVQGAPSNKICPQCLTLAYTDHSHPREWCFNCRHVGFYWVPGPQMKLFYLDP